MATPVLITVTGTVNGGLADGYIEFRSDTLARHATSDSVLTAEAWSAPIIAGHVSITVPASNDPAWSPSSWTYQVRVVTDDEDTTFTTVVPYDAPGATVGLSALLPTIAATGNLYAPYNHNHDGRYTTPAQVAAAINAVAPAGSWVNVRDTAYGAKGDGTTVDDAAFTAAIAALGSGGTLYVPAGTYVVTGIVVQNLSDFSIVGGRGAKIVMAGNTTAAPNRASANILTLVNCTDFAIDGLTLDGRRDTIAPLTTLAGNAAAGQASVTVASGLGARYLVGQRLNVCGGLTANAGGDVDKQDQQKVIASITTGVGGAADTITFTTNLGNTYTAGGAVVSDPYGPMAANGAYVTPWQTGQATIAGRVLVEEDQQQGIHLIRCARFRISGCTVRNVWESPIRCGTHLLDGTAQNDGCTDGTITGNTLYHGYDQGVGIWVSKKITVTGNTINAPGWSGVCMTVADFCTVTGNIIDNCAQPIPTDTKAGHGVAIEGGVGNIIADNVIRNSRGRGVYLTAGGTHPFGGPAQQATTIGAGSDNVTLPAAAITLGNAGAFTNAGSVTIMSSAGAQQVTYTGKTGNQLTGCAGGVGTLYTGSRVVQYGVFLANGAALQIGSTTTTVSDGTKFQPGGRYSIIDGPRTERIDVTTIAGNVLTLAGPTKFRHLDKVQVGQTVAEGNLISNNSISDSGDAGVGVSAGVTTVIKGNRVDRSGLRGVDLVLWAAGGVQPPCGTLIEGNAITAPDTTGDGAAYQAVGAQAVTDFQIIGNRCGGALATTGYFHAIGVLGCSNFVVANNAISDAYATGIRVDAYQNWVSQNGRVAGNQLARCLLEAMLFWGGLNLLVEGNIITGSAANNGPAGYGGAMNIRGVKDSIFQGNQVIDNGRGVGIDDATVPGATLTATGNKFLANIVVDTGRNYDPFSGAGTQQNFGIKELGGTPGGNQYVDNVIKGNQTNWSITSTGNTLRGNTNYNPVGKFGSQPTVPASGVAQTNDRNADATVYIVGGTVTAVSVGGQPTGATSGAFPVPAGQSIAVTYSVAPTWTWYGN